MGADAKRRGTPARPIDSKSKIKDTDQSICGLFLKRLVAKRRKRARAELTMTHRLFLLRDDAIFLHILGFCWFVDTERRLRYAGAE